MSEEQITELTEAQIALFPEYVNRWVNIGLSCERAVPELAEKYIDHVYREAKMAPPKYLFLASSPIHCCHIAGVLNELVLQNYFANGDPPHSVLDKEIQKRLDKLDEETKDEYVAAFFEDQVYGSHDAAWLSFYNFFHEQFNLECTKQLVPLMQLAEVCGWWAPYEKFAIYQHRHDSISRDDQRRLHNENGPAIHYPDGFELYGIDGVIVDKQTVMNPDSLTLQQIHTQEDAEWKRIMIQRHGWDKFLQKSNAVELDKGFDKDGIAEYLMQADDGNGGKIHALATACTSTRKKFFMEVSDECSTIEEAKKYLQNDQDYDLIAQS